MGYGTKWGTNTGRCRICDAPAPLKRISPKGKPHYRAYCTKHAKLHESGKSESYRKHVKMECENCGFIACHPAQMDVHHIDHNHKNNDPSNLVTLCACCHRLEHLNGNQQGSYEPSINITVQLQLGF